MGKHETPSLIDPVLYNLGRQSQVERLTVIQIRTLNSSKSADSYKTDAKQ